MACKCGQQMVIHAPPGGTTCIGSNFGHQVVLGKGAKKRRKKLTNVSFMYVCVAGNGEMLVFFFSFFPPTIV